jgi:hypothetical protein
VLVISAVLMRLIGPIEAAFIDPEPNAFTFLNSMKLLRVTIAGA